MIWRIDVRAQMLRRRKCFAQHTVALDRSNGLQFKRPVVLARPKRRLLVERVSKVDHLRPTSSDVV
jgi:hypothetical protein